MRPATAIVLTAAAAAAQAQHQPYAGQQQRDLKALSADEVKQYLEGAGLGYAKPAELNHYPGPPRAALRDLAARGFTSCRGAVDLCELSSKANTAGLTLKRTDVCAPC